MERDDDSKKSHLALEKPPKRPEAILVKAADMMIARRADTRARADFATWKMMAKLNGASALPPERRQIDGDPDAAESLLDYRR
jgi:hypothetical protein